MNWILGVLALLSILDGAVYAKSKRTGLVPVTSVQAQMQTFPVSSIGDAADDLAVWVNRGDRAKSRILGTDKDAGVYVYDLSGKIVQFLSGSLPNNIDLKYDVQVAGGEKTDIAVGTDRRDQTLAVFKVSAEDGRLTKLNTENLKSKLKEVYGICLYHARQASALYAYIPEKKGLVEVWKLSLGPGDSVEGKILGNLRTRGQSEGCVMDEDLGVLWVGEEKKGVWKFAIDPNTGLQASAPKLQIPLAQGLTADVEGVALYRKKAGEGYLVVSSQGDSTFAIFDRKPPHALLKRFRIIASDKIDEVSGTDGIEVLSFGLPTIFPNGLFLAQDGKTATNQNFKAVSWKAIAETGSTKLDMETDLAPWE